MRKQRKISKMWILFGIIISSSWGYINSNDSNSTIIDNCKFQRVILYECNDSLTKYQVCNKGCMNTKLYIDRYKELAIIEMYRTGIPASVTMAQAIVESGNGNSRICRLANNHFGVKANRNWSGPIIIEDDDKPREHFRSYNNSYWSFVDHSNVICCSGIYNSLFKYKDTDYINWCFGLKRCGYATSKQYPFKLLEIIRQNKLERLDSINYDGLLIFSENKIDTILRKCQIEKQTTIAKHILQPKRKLKSKKMRKH